MRSLLRAKYQEAIDRGKSQHCPDFWYNLISNPDDYRKLRAQAIIGVNLREQDPKFAERERLFVDV
ncbi:MAG: hypothetical protein AB4290_26560, partial [Spirulina sp.]